MVQAIKYYKDSYGKILKLMLTIGCDKYMHFSVGGVMFSLLYVMIGWVSLGAVIIVAIGKEWYDSNTEGHTVDPLDTAVTILDALVAAIPLLIK